MAISYEPELLLARDQGLKLVSIGALVQRPLTSIIALPAAAHHERRGPRRARPSAPPASPTRRRAADGAAAPPASAPARSRKSTWASTSYPRCSPARSTRRSGGSGTTRRIQLALVHKHPTVIPVDQAGVPTYDELVLVVREGDARTRGQDSALLPAGAHAAASARCAPTRRRRPRWSSRPTPRCKHKLQLESIRRTLPAALPPTRASPTAGRNPSAWAALRRTGCTRRPLTHASTEGRLPPFTNEFLPGQGI